MPRKKGVKKKGGEEGRQADMGSTNYWSLLSTELQLNVISLLPNSTTKLAMRFVAKSWEELLDSPEAHTNAGLKTPDTAMKLLYDLPFNCLKHIKYLRLHHTNISLQQARQNLLALTAAAELEELKIQVDSASDLEGLPYFPHLRHLDATGSVSYFENYSNREAQYEPSPFSAKFLPALEKLNLEFMVADIMKLGQHLERFQNLKELCLGQVYPDELNGLETLAFPVNSQLRLNMEVGCSQNNDVHVPANLCAAVTVLELDIDASLLAVNLGLLAVCDNLTKLYITVCLPDEDHDANPVLLKGLHMLPAGLVDFSVASNVLPSFHSKEYAEHIARFLHAGFDERGVHLWTYQIKEV